MAVTYAVTLEYFIDGAWLNVTRLNDDTRLLGTDSGDSGVDIEFGRASESGRPTPTAVTYDYLDNNATFDGDNPFSAYYRKIGLGTPVRLSIDGDVRAVLELESMLPIADDIDDVVRVSIRASDITQRLSGEGESPIGSPATRALMSEVNDANRIAYWPLEEESGAESISSPMGSPTPSLGGEISFGAYTDAPSSARLATFGTDGQMFFTVPSYTGDTKLISLWHIPSTSTPSLPTGTRLLRLYFDGGSVDIIDFHFGTSFDGSLHFKIYGGGLLLNTGTVHNFISRTIGQHFMVSIELAQDGPDLDTALLVVNATGNGLASQTFAGRTIGRLAFFAVAMDDCAGVSFGQPAVANDTGAFPNYISSVNGSLGTSGFKGERVGRRIERLCEEEGIPITIVGDPDDTVRTGPQTINTLYELLASEADLDGGLLYGTRTALELTYRTRVSLYNQWGTALDYAHVHKGFRSTSDNQGVLNDITIDRSGGSSFRYVIPDDDEAHWTTQPPPAGANRRPASFTLGAYSDADLVQLAAWRTHVAAWREKRFPALPLWLERDAFSAADQTEIKNLELGDVVRLDASAAPDWFPYDEIRLMVQGGRETLSQLAHRFTFNTTPADIYEVEVTDTSGSTLAVAIDDNDTSAKLATSLGPEWFTGAPLDTAYQLQFAGQPVTVTTMTNDTPAFIAAGVVAHAVNSSVTPGLPAGITPDVGQLLLIWAAIRNSGTGTPDDEPGWRTIHSFANTKLYGRYYVTGDSAPVITFTGGAAGADTSARMFAFSGLSMELGSGTEAVPAVAELLNGVTQDVAYPALALVRAGSTALIFAWKQDDATGYATPSGYTEMADNSTTTGSDQSIAAYYDLTAVDADAGSLVVTGGLTAISRAIVLALRPLQTAAITRGVASAAASVAAAAVVRAWRPGVNGL